MPRSEPASTRNSSVSTSASMNDPGGRNYWFCPKRCTAPQNPTVHHDVPCWNCFKFRPASPTFIKEKKKLWLMFNSPFLFAKSSLLLVESPCCRFNPHSCWLKSTCLLVKILIVGKKIQVLAGTIIFFCLLTPHVNWLVPNFCWLTLVFCCKIPGFLPLMSPCVLPISSGALPTFDG